MTQEKDRHKKKKYRSPRLTTYGNFKQITKVKGGSRTDGTGKPSTKSSGANA